MAGRHRGGRPTQPSPNRPPAPREPEGLLPLYAALRGRYEGRRFDERANTSLVFDKFLHTWPGADGRLSLDGEKLGQARHRFLDAVRARGYPHAELLAEHIARRQTHVDALGGRRLSARTEWRFVSGVGAAHPTESGFVWHRTLGLPYLPGSSVKGMMRAWARAGWGGAREREAVARLFGDEGAGSLIVFDALPERPPELAVDVLNVHYQGYYQGKRPPADYLSPVPVYFLTVAPGQALEFALAPRPGAPTGAADVEEGARLLAEALTWIGAGAKTSAGYGRFTVAGAEKERVEHAAAPAGEPIPAEDFAVEALRLQLSRYSDREKGQIAERVRQLTALPDTPARAELAWMFWQRLFPSENRRRREEGRSWYPQLLELLPPDRRPAP